MPAHRPGSPVPGVRVSVPNRLQTELRITDLDGLLPEDHAARAVWSFVESLDVAALYQGIKSVEGSAGRPAIDPRILLSLWLFATLEGVGSARAVARLCGEHIAYRWLCGGVGVNHHALSDFRVGHEDFLDGLLTNGVATLLHAGLVTMQRVSQDGMRVRASAGAASFRRRPRLDQLRADAREQLSALKKELAEDPGGADQRRQAARQRAARERAKRLQQAIDVMSELDGKRTAKEREKTRVSTTDAEARVMKMGDGGFRPAVNVQFAADVETQVIVGVDVTNVGSDLGLMLPMVDQLNSRYGRKPSELLADGGFAKLDDIDALARGGITVYAPVMTVRGGTARDPHQALPGDTPGVAAWRARMGVESAKEIYKERAASIECVNAQVRNRGLIRLMVRGLTKAKCVALWHAIVHNLVKSWGLRPQAT